MRTSPVWPRWSVPTAPWLPVSPTGAPECSRSTFPSDPAATVSRRRASGKRTDHPRQPSAGLGCGASGAPSGGEPEPERGSCGERAERTDTDPPGRAVDPRGPRGPGRAAEEVGDHIRGDDPAAGLRSERVDGALVADVERLRAEVEDDDASAQRSGRAGTQ